MDRMLLVGMDEAGYGPNLGPLVLGRCVFRGPPSFATRDWWSALSPIVTRDGSKGSLAVDDSKRILGRSGGRGRLEETVSAFRGLLEPLPLDLEGRVAQVAASSLADLRREHWFRAAEPSSGPVRSRDTALADCLAEQDLELVAYDACLVFPGDFNRRLDRLGNKAAALAELVVERIEAVAREPGWIVVDRLGGRRYYGTLIEPIANGRSWKPLAEEPSSASYRIEDPRGTVEIRFEVGADRRFLPVALASMLAKSLREACMDAFARFWQERAPHVRPTRGYPADARRFLEEMGHLLEEEGIPPGDFWRRL